MGRIVGVINPADSVALPLALEKAKEPRAITDTGALASTESIVTAVVAFDADIAVVAVITVSGFKPDRLLDWMLDDVPNLASFPLDREYSFRSLLSARCYSPRLTRSAL